MKHINAFYIVLLISAIVLITTVIVIKLISHSDKIDYGTEAFFESTKPLQNPYCGFYRIIGYTLSDDCVLPDNLARQINSYTNPLVLLEINLKNYRNGEISEKALSQLNGILSHWAQSPNGTKLILRFLYDWNGVAAATEPYSLNTVLTHMEQISTAVNRRSDCIYIMQGVFIGNWGEMHNSRFSDENSVKTLIQRLNDVIDPKIFLSVRTPAQWRSLKGTLRPSLSARLGLFNDGILGSESDLGTYVNRNKELEFQNDLCRYVPNGGEVVFNHNLSELKTSVSALGTMHVSYLNEDYDSRVYEKWKDCVWTGNDAFNGCNGYDYIKAHLGYRYLIDSCKIKKSGFIWRQYTLCLTLKNCGFSNALKPQKAAVTIINTNTEKCVQIPVDADLTTLFSENKNNFTVTLPVRKLERGEYQIYFSVTDETSGRQILFGNKNEPNKNGYLLGRLKK